LGAGELKHYGVLGMRWGIRKDRSYTNGGRIAKGTKLLRLSSQKKEKNKGAAYAYINENLQQDPSGKQQWVANPNYKSDIKKRSN